jgi:hypothetical protein
MPSTYTGLGVQLMATGEKAGTWGTLTNTNWDIIEQIAGGYIEQDIAGGAQTTTLSVSDGSTGAVLAHRVIKFTGAITGNQIVTIPLDVQQSYLILNGTTGAYTVQLKYVSGSGSSVTWATDNKKTKILYACADDGTNPNIVDATSDFGEVTLTGTQTLTNKTLTSPAIGTSILDTNGLQLALVTATGSAVNEFTIANAAAGAGPTLSATGDESNVPINITPKGTGDVFINPPSSGSLAIKGNATNGGTFKIFEDTDLGSYHTGFTAGNLTEDIVYTLPLADAAASGDALTSNSSGVLSWTTMSGGTSWQAVETGATMTAVAGEGYFINTTSNACTATLPAGSIGDECTFVDYAATFDSNNLTVGRNGSDKINGSAADLTVAVERAAFTLVFTDSTQGWLLKDK